MADNNTYQSKYSGEQIDATVQLTIDNQKNIQSAEKRIDDTEKLATDNQKNIQDVKDNVVSLEEHIDSEIDELREFASSEFDQLKKYTYYGDTRTTPSDISLFNFEYSQENDAYYVGAAWSPSDSSITQIVIPYQYDGKIVMGIRSGGFSNYVHLKKVVMPNTILYLGMDCFSGCSSLSSVVFSDNLMATYGGEFSGCDLPIDLVLPDSVEYLFGGITFSNTNIRSVVIPENYTTINDGAFANCSSLTKVTIMGKLNDGIGSGAFNNCESLTDIYYAGTEEEWNSVNIEAYNESLLNATIHYGCVPATQGYVDEKIKSIPSGGGGVASIAELKSLMIDAHKYYRGTSVVPSDASLFKTSPWDSDTEVSIVAVSKELSGDIVIPYEYLSNGVKQSVVCVGSEAFKDSQGITSVVIPEGVHLINDEAFYNCQNLKSVRIPKSVNVINGFAFMGCENLTDVYYSGTEEQWKRIEILDIYIPNSPILKATVHCDCVASGEFHERVQYYGDSSIMPSDTSLSNFMRSGEGIEYYYGNDVNVVVPYKLDGVIITELLSYSFSYGDFVSVTIPNTITRIGDYVFSYRNNLTNITFSDSVASIGEGAFEGCENLTDVYYRGTEEEWGEIDIGANNDALLNANIHFGVITSLNAAIKEIVSLKEIINLLYAKSLVKTVEISLPSSGWVGEGNNYSQVVTIADVTQYSKIDLQPTPEQLVIFYEKDVTFVAENDNKVVTIYCIGQKPMNDYVIQATVTEVV